MTKCLPHESNNLFKITFTRACARACALSARENNRGKKYAESCARMMGWDEGKGGEEIGDWRDYDVKCPWAKIVCYNTTSLSVYLSMHASPHAHAFFYFSTIFSICITPGVSAAFAADPYVILRVAPSKNRNRYNTYQSAIVSADENSLYITR